MIFRRILIALVGIGLILLVFVLVIKGITGHKKSSSPIKQSNLSQYADTDATAQLYIDGPIKIDQDHRAVKISVNKTQTQIDIIQGYQGNVINTQTFANNQPAYAVFLQALKLQDFAKGNTSPGAGDERGVCPNNDRFIYSLVNNNSNVFRFWSTSCGGGTFSGKGSEVRRLFIRQIPQTEFNKLTSGIPLG